MSENDPPELPGEVWRGTYDTDACPCAIDADGKAFVLINTKWRRAGAEDDRAVHMAAFRSERARAEKAERELAEALRTLADFQAVALGRTE